MRTKLATVMMILAIAAFGLVCSPAGCNCTGTCGNITLCVAVGHGDCQQYWENRCQSGSCGGWFPFRDDCYYTCKWTNYECPLGQDCELITYYWEACVG